MGGSGVVCMALGVFFGGFTSRLEQNRESGNRGLCGYDMILGFTDLGMNRLIDCEAMRARSSCNATIEKPPSIES
jgi:hypothetical protein